VFPPVFPDQFPDYVVRPWPGRIQGASGPDLEPVAGQTIHRFDADDSPFPDEETFRLDIIGGNKAFRRGRSQD
jgi:hypothetical protein